jgi:heat shock protein HslJ
MADSEWGLCKDCKWWQIEPDAKVTNLTLGECIEEELQDLKLRVSGNSGCNRFMSGKVARAAGSSAAPPTAAPTR